MMYNFTGKTALVTGAAMGIGKAVALRIAEEGANTVLLDLPDRNTGGISEKLNETIQEIEGMGVKALGIPADVSDAESVKKAFEKAVEVFGTLDFVVNVAGIAESPQPLDEMDYTILDRVYRVNVRGTFNIDKEATILFKKQKSGKLVNFSSINGITGYAGPYAYNASKFSVTGITQTLARELGPYGVNVNCVCPGFVWTPMWQANDEYLWSVEHPGEEYVPMTYYMKQCETTCMKKPTYPGDIANTVAFLLSDQASNITGQHINVDCGLEFH